MLPAFLARDFDILMTRYTAARMQEIFKRPKITRQNDRFGKNMHFETKTEINRFLNISWQNSSNLDIYMTKLAQKGVKNPKKQF